MQSLILAVNFTYTLDRWHVCILYYVLWALSLKFSLKDSVALWWYKQQNDVNL